MLSSAFGPATSWHITYNTAGFIVMVDTNLGSYQVGRIMGQKSTAMLAVSTRAHRRAHCWQSALCTL
jgi:hypothetical protein